MVGKSKAKRNSFIILSTCLIMIFSSSSVSAASSTTTTGTTFSTPASFISTVGPVCKDIAGSNDLYASVMIAQAILESNWGKSSLTVEANNFFGIKGSYQGAYVEKLTYEYKADGTKYQVVAKFRKYPTINESFQDNANLLKTYKGFYSGAWKSNTSSYRDATAALTGKYATDPKYGTKLNNLITTYNLTQYDTGKTATGTVTIKNVSKKFKTKQNLNVRASYNTSSGILRTIPKGTSVSASKMTSGGASVSGNKTWYYVDNQGWISAYYLEEIVESKTPVVTEKTIDKKFKVTENLRIRTSYTTKSNQLGLLSKGTTVTASKIVTEGESVNKNKAWYYVDKRGWVSGNYLSEVKSEEKTTPVVEKEYGTTKEALNVRKSASTDSKKLRTIKKGVKFTITATNKKGQSVKGNKTWYQVNNNGWVSAYYVKLEGDTAQATVKKTGTTKEVLNVRKSASTDAKKLRTVKKGVKFTITATNKNGQSVKGNKTWYQVNNNGWVSAYYVK